MTEERFTICLECRHVHAKQDGPRTHVWYNNACTASPVEKERDPFDGKWKYPFGEEFKRCREVNTHGKCPKFEPAGTMDKVKQKVKAVAEKVFY